MANLLKMSLFDDKNERAQSSETPLLPISDETLLLRERDSKIDPQQVVDKALSALGICELLKTLVEHAAMKMELLKTVEILEGKVSVARGLLGKDLTQFDSMSLLITLTSIEQIQDFLDYFLTRKLKK
jgi:hypothetical protein